MEPEELQVTLSNIIDNQTWKPINKSFIKDVFCSSGLTSLESLQLLFKSADEGVGFFASNTIPEGFRLDLVRSVNGKEITKGHNTISDDDDDVFVVEASSDIHISKKTKLLNTETKTKIVATGKRVVTYLRDILEEIAGVFDKPTFPSKFESNKTIHLWDDLSLTGSQYAFYRLKSFATLLYRLFDRRCTPETNLKDWLFQTVKVALEAVTGIRTDDLDKLGGTQATFVYKIFLFDPKKYAATDRLSDSELPRTLHDEMNASTIVPPTAVHADVVLTNSLFTTANLPAGDVDNEVALSNTLTLDPQAEVPGESSMVVTGGEIPILEPLLAAVESGDGNQTEVLLDSCEKKDETPSNYANVAFTHPFLNSALITSTTVDYASTSTIVESEQERIVRLQGEDNERISVLDNVTNGQEKGKKVNIPLLRGRSERKKFVASKLQYNDEV